MPAILYTIFSISFFVLLIVSLISVVLAHAKDRELSLLKEEFKLKNNHLRNKVYELTVLQEIGRRIGYSLSLEKVADILAGSLGDILDYSVSSYLIMDKKRLKFKAFLRDSVSSDYIKRFEKFTLESFTKETKIDLKKMAIEEFITGALLNNESEELPQSYFYIPLQTAASTVGLISISSRHPDLYRNKVGKDLLITISSQAMTALENLQKIFGSEHEKISTMLESLSDGVLFLDKDFKIIISNSAARGMLHITEKDSTVLDLIKRLEKVDLGDKLEQALKLKKSFSISEIKIESRYLKLHISNVSSKAANKYMDGVVILIQDISRQKQLEKMREDFTSMMVHDLRAPLTVMVGSSDILLKREKDLSQGQRTQLLFDIKKGAGALLEIVNDLLDVAKMEKGKFDLHKVPKNIVSFVERKVEYYRSLIEDRGIKFVVDVPDRSIKVSFDENLVGRVISNLLSNANKFTEKGTVTVTVKLVKIHGFAKLGVTKVQDFVKVSISDTGIGINKDALKHLFNKFEQLRNPVDAKQKGTGLGLVIAKKIVEEHKGKIGVISKEGSGSTFWFTLPVYKFSKKG